jgi:hypothetical protein
VIEYLALRVDINKLNHDGMSELELSLKTPQYKESLAALLECGADLVQAST